MKMDTETLTTDRLKAAYIQAQTRAAACGRPVCAIVGSSVPEQEYEETRLKLSGMRKAIAMARMSAKLCT